MPSQGNSWGRNPAQILRAKLCIFVQGYFLFEERSLPNCTKVPCGLEAGPITLYPFSTPPFLFHSVPRSTVPDSIAAFL